VSAGAVVAAALIGGAIVFGSVLALRGGRANPASCAGALALDVTTTASLAVPLQKEAADFNSARHAVAGQCVTVRVTTRASADVVAGLGQGAPAAADGTIPDVWVPESSNWLGIAREASATAAALLPEKATTIASSPIVIATPLPMAQALGWPEKQLTWSQLAQNEGSTTLWSKNGHSDWGAFKIGYADPPNSAAGLATVIGVSATGLKRAPGDLSTASFLQDRSEQLRVLMLERRAAFVPKTDDEMIAALRKADISGQALSYLSAFPMQESDLVAYNLGVGSPTGQPPKVALAASYPSDGLYNQAVPYAVLTPAGNPARTQAAQAFLAAVRSPAGQGLLAAAGFRSATGVNEALTVEQGAQPSLPTTTPEDISGGVLRAAQTLFTSVHQRGATLALLDGSGSMTEIVPGNPPMSKIQIAINACLEGVQLFAPNDKVGLGIFATNVPGGVWKQLTPVVPLNVKGRYGTHKDDLIQLGDMIQRGDMPVPGGDTPLYQAALASFRARSANYTPGRLNEVVLLTDGKNDDPKDPRDLTLPDLLKTLRAEYNPKKPVHIITIAYGADADPSALKQISDATGAKSYRSRDPRDILNVFINAVLQASE
jgi:Ca-activated chloride channel family protein